MSELNNISVSINMITTTQFGQKIITQDHADI